jgi:pimeloyl-[acyl-carrier protein] methyl ester esterase
VTRVALMAATPCFAQREDWPHAVRAEILRDFARSLAADCEATLKRFLALQALGDARAGQVARRLREALFARGRPDASALQRSLAMLLGADLRRQLAAVAQPALVIHGERDGLAPPSAGAHLSRMLPNARLVMMRGAAHAPFLSSAGEVGALLADFFHGG